MMRGASGKSRSSRTSQHANKLVNQGLVANPFLVGYGRLSQPYRDLINHNGSRMRKRGRCLIHVRILWDSFYIEVLKEDYDVELVPDASTPFSKGSNAGYDPFLVIFFQEELTCFNLRTILEKPD